MRRQSVPRVEVAPLSARLSALLRPREVAPVYDRVLQPLVGVRWPRGVPRAPLPGEVPMFDIEDEGELQEWEPRGRA